LIGSSKTEAKLRQVPDFKHLSYEHSLLEEFRSETLELGNKDALCHSTHAPDTIMKFLLIKGEYFRERSQGFPTPWEFASSGLLVVCTEDDKEIVAACGIRSLLNVLVLHVKEGHRGRGVGAQLLKKTIEEAKKRRLGFITLSVSSDNAVAFNLYHRFGFKEITLLKKPKLILMMLPLTCMGKLAYGFSHIIRCLVPSMFLAYTHMWLYRRTV